MPLTITEIRDLRFETQTLGERLLALRDLVVEVYGVDSGAALSFIRAVENMKHLQQVLAKPLDTPAEAPSPPPSPRLSDGIVPAIEATAITYLLDSIMERDSTDDD